MGQLLFEGALALADLVLEMLLALVWPTSREKRSRRTLSFREVGAGPRADRVGRL
jgi:hypothetical protein